MLSKAVFSKVLVGTLVASSNYFDYKNLALCFEDPPTRERIRGEYENKIRRMSPPEKIFEVFATQKVEDAIYMSHYDLFKALSPYTFSSKEKSEDDDEKKKDFKSNALIEFADVDGDGMISLYEYYFLVTFLQTPTKAFNTYFNDKKDKVGEIKREDFAKFLDAIQSGSYQLTMSGILPDPRKNHLSEEELKKVQEAITNNIFKNKNTTPLANILRLREKIYKDIYSFEFGTFKTDEKGNISGEDFAKSIICYLQPSLISKFWSDLNDEKFPGVVTLDQYVTFQRFFREELEHLQDKIKEKGVLSRKALSKIITEFSTKQKTPISQTQIDILIKVLDSNKNNKIDQHEFLGVLQSRVFYGASEATEKFSWEMLYELGNRWLNKAERIVEIIKE